MIDLTLKFTNAAEAETLLTDAGLWDAEHGPLTASHDHALDLIGSLTIGAGGGKVVEADGYWLNLRLLQEDAVIAKTLSPFIVDPLTSPVRVWSGSSGLLSPKDKRWIAREETFREPLPAEIKTQVLKPKPGAIPRDKVTVAVVEEKP